MANPLKMLKLKPTAIQFIQEVPINATPKKVWASLVDVSKWFYFDPSEAAQAKHVFDVRPGGLWTSEYPDGTAMHMGTVAYIEPMKLLRVMGSLGMTHVPVNGVIIFELQPSADGKKTVLRVGTRMFGFLDKDVKKRYQGGWKQLFMQLKAVAEK